MTAVHQHIGRHQNLGAGVDGEDRTVVANAEPGQRLARDSSRWRIQSMRENSVLGSCSDIEGVPRRAARTALSSV